MLDDAAIFLRHAGQEAGHIHERHDRDVEGIAETHEAAGLLAGIDVEAAGQYRRLVGDDAHGMAFDARKTDQDIAGMAGLQLEEFAIVGDLLDQLVHVVRLGGAGRDQRIEAVVNAQRIIAGRPERRILAVVERQEIEEHPRAQQCIDIIFQRQIGHPGFGAVGDGAAQLFLSHHLVRHRLHHVRASDEHVA